MAGGDNEVVELLDSDDDEVVGGGGGGGGRAADDDVQVVEAERQVRKEAPRAGAGDEDDDIEVTGEKNKQVFRWKQGTPVTRSKGGPWNTRRRRSGVDIRAALT